MSIAIDPNSVGIIAYKPTSGSRSILIDSELLTKRSFQMKKTMIALALLATAANASASAKPPEKICNFMGNWNGIITAIFRGSPFTCVYY